MSKISRFVTFLILVCVLQTVACTSEITDSGDVLYDIGGVTLPLPAELNAVRTRGDLAKFETEFPAEDIIVYLNLNWPQAGLEGFIETNPSGFGSGSGSSSYDVILPPIFFPRLRRGNSEPSKHFDTTYYGAFTNNAGTYLPVRVEDIMEIYEDETIRKTIVRISEEEMNTFRQPESVFDRLPVPAIDHRLGVEVDWSLFPIPDGRVDEMGMGYGEHNIIVEQSALETAKQINEMWDAAQLDGFVDIDNPMSGHSTFPKFEKSYNFYSGRFDEGDFTYQVTVQPDWEDEMGSVEVTQLYCDAQWTNPNVDFDTLLLPNIVDEKRFVWSRVTQFMASTPSGESGRSYMTDISAEATIAFFDLVWTDAGFVGEMSDEPSGRWVSGTPHAEQVYYDGRFDDSKENTAYIVRVYDIEGAEETAISINTLLIPHADQLGY